jgi:hypothetical protein
MPIVNITEMGGTSCKETIAESISPKIMQTKANDVQSPESR